MLTSVFGTLLVPLACSKLPYIQFYVYLEGQVLQEVSRSIGLVCLGPTTSINPNTDRRSLCPWRMFSRDLAKISLGTSIDQVIPTVSPLDNVVLSVCAPWLTGVANPLSGDIDWRALRLRNALVKLRASRCVAIAMGRSSKSPL